MKQEFYGKASTVEEAKEDALRQAKEAVQVAFASEYEVTEEPRKGMFGIGKKDAVVKLTVTYTEAQQPAQKVQKPAGELQQPQEQQSAEDPNAERVEIAKRYLDDILSGMGLENIHYTIKQEEGNNFTFTFDGEDIGVLIGHHGETLDSLQYLVGLASNRLKDGTYCRITLDGGSYREKREQTLKELAKKIGEKVKRTGRSQMLEPMNPYERRIIHAVVSEIPGIFSKSKGEDPNRRVIIISENPRQNHYNGSRSKNGRRPSQGSNYRGQRSGGYTRTSNKPTIEQMLKEDKDYVNRTTKAKNDDQLDAKLYSKIELD